MKKFLFAIFAFLIVFSLGIIFRDKIQATFFPIKEIHIHAGFQVYENGRQVSFADIRYMNDKPCGDHSPGEHVDEQLEKAHLHDLVGDVVHVHRVGAQWGDLFQNIKYPVNGSIAEAYINGKRLKDIKVLSDTPIKPYDNLILFIGAHGEVKQYIDKAVTKAHILEVEKRSETCGATPAK